MKSEKHLSFIRSLPCLICGDDTATEACHVRYSMHPKVNPGIGAKPGDEWTVPMCSSHHRHQHSGSELEFWRTVGINPLDVAETLYKLTGDHLMASNYIAEVQNGPSPE